jgi:hypothetical protein
MTPFDKLKETHSESYSDIPFSEFKELYRKKFYPDMSPEKFTRSLGAATPPERPAIQYTTQPYVEPEMSDALMVSETGVKTSPQAAKATIRNVLQGVSFGTADEAEAALRSAFGEQTYAQNIEQIRAEMKSYAAENPGSAIAQELVGAVMSPATLLKAPAYIERLAPMVRGGIKGGTGGFAYGVGSAEGGLGERLEEGAVSAGVGIFIGAPLEKLASTIGNVKLNKAIKDQQKMPDLDKLRTIKDAAYEAVDQTEFAIGPGQAQQIYQRASKVAADNFYIPEPTTRTAVDKAQRLLESLTNKGMTLGQSEQIRRRLFALAADKENGYIVRQMIHEFDDVIDDAMAEGGTSALKVAREANRKYKNVEAIEDAFKAVDAPVGRRTEAYKKVAQRLLKDEKQMRFFNDAERKLIEDMASGTLSQNVLNTFGKFQFTAKGLAGAINLVTLTTAPWTALLFIGTSGAKYIADRKSIQLARDLIKKAGGVEAVRKAAGNPNMVSGTLGGVSADEIRETFLLKDE